MTTRIFSTSSILTKESLATSNSERHRKEIIDGAKRIYKYCDITEGIRF